MAWFPPVYQSPKFEYPSLHSKPRTFRVIKLLPTTRSLQPPFRESLNVRIMEIDVDESAGKYISLSYCWGLDKTKKCVNVLIPGIDDSGMVPHVIYISASLEEALLSLAREANAEASLPIFADQICINQADNDEKIQQVRLMGDIYSRSARTVVWLGEGSPDTSRFYDFSTKVSSEGIMSRVMGPNVGHFPKVFNAVKDSSNHLETEAEKEDRDAILDLVSRYGPEFPVRGMGEIFRVAWSSRLWTVQEGCLPSDVSFRCGGKSLCIECFRGIMLFYSICTTYWVRNLNASVPKDEVLMRQEIYTLNKGFFRLMQQRKMIHGPRGPPRLLYNVVLMYNVNDDSPKVGATKAEDRIYALLGLADNDDIARETVEGMEIDNVKGTYTKFAASVMKRNVDVLLFSQFPKSPTYGPELPSWVPDWSTEHLRTPHGYSNLSTPVFSAGGHEIGHNAVVDISTGTIRLNAISVGRVIHVGTRCMQRDPSSIVPSIDFISARRFFVELEVFLEAAADLNPIHAPNISDDRQRLDSLVRISDGGLSLREFPKRFDPVSSSAILQEIYKSVTHYGQLLIDVENKTHLASSFTSSFRSVGIMPWYWTPASEIDVLRLCAIDPIAAGRTWLTGFYLAVEDVVMVKYYSTYVRLETFISRLRRERQSTMQVGWANEKSLGKEHIFDKIGLKSHLVSSPEWEHYTNSLLKNARRRLFLTETGYVGLGPDHMAVGDAIIVIPGGSVPHVLRHQSVSDPTSHDGSSPGSLTWSYVGEAYCDGVMDGELVDGTDKVLRSFEMV